MMCFISIEIYNILYQLVGKPHCFSKKEYRIFVNNSDSVMLTFDVYGLNITHFDWFSGIHNLTQSLEYEFTTEPSITSVSIYGTSVSLNTMRYTLKISNLTESNFDTLYTLFIYNEYGNSSCSMKLLEGRKYRIDIDAVSKKY